MILWSYHVRPVIIIIIINILFTHHVFIELLIEVHRILALSFLGWCHSQKSRLEIRPSLCFIFKFWKSMVSVWRSDEHYSAFPPHSYPCGLFPTRGESFLQPYYMFETNKKLLNLVTTNSLHPMFFRTSPVAFYFEAPLFTLFCLLVISLLFFVYWWFLCCFLLTVVLFTLFCLLTFSSSLAWVHFPDVFEPRMAWWEIWWNRFCWTSLGAENEIIKTRKWKIWNIE